MKRARTNRIIVPIVFAITLAGCGTRPGALNVSPTAAASSVPSESPEVLDSYTFYYVADTANGLRLYKETQAISATENDLGVDKGLNALVMLINGQLPPTDGNYQNLWRTGSKVNSITRAGDVETVDISLGRLQVGAEAEQRAIDQIVWTLTENDPSVKSVKFTVEGKSVESLAGHVDATKAFTREPQNEVLATVWVDLLDGSDLVSPVKISGTACTFEANVGWELLQNSKVIKSGATTAASACPDRSSWSVDLGALPAGDYTFRAFDTSAKDGSLINEDTKDFTIN
jgi:spore germination protein GerM